MTDPTDARRRLRRASMIRQLRAITNANPIHRAKITGRAARNPNMDHAFIDVDLRIAKQRRAHAVSLPFSDDYRYETDIVQALRFLRDNGHNRILLRGDAGTAMITVERIDDPKPEDVDP